jgi:hypothetical protein
MSFTRSTGQGFESSHSNRMLNTANRFCIVQRLVARSLSGDGLHIQTHQHFGHRLHLVWSRPSIQCSLDDELDVEDRVRINCELGRVAVRPDDRCLERVIPIGVDSFFKELVNGGAQDLFFCACRYGWLPFQSRG